MNGIPRALEENDQIVKHVPGGIKERKKHQEVKMGEGALK
jgi:hypothetical protein